MSCRTQRPTQRHTATRPPTHATAPTHTTRRCMVSLTCCLLEPGVGGLLQLHTWGSGLPCLQRREIRKRHAPPETHTTTADAGQQKQNSSQPSQPASAGSLVHTYQRTQPAMRWPDWRGRFGATLAAATQMQSPCGVRCCGEAAGLTAQGPCQHGSCIHCYLL